MMAAKSFRPPFRTLDQGLHWIRILSAELYTRLHDDYEINSRWPKTLVVSTKISIISLSLSLSFLMTFASSTTIFFSNKNILINIICSYILVLQMNLSQKVLQYLLD